MKTECTCTFAQKMTGDGCEVCNPAKALEIAQALLAEKAVEIAELKDHVDDAIHRGLLISALKEQLRASNEAQEYSLGYAQRLAVSVAKKHYSEVANTFEPLDTIDGVISQLDNMFTGLVNEKLLHASNEALVAAEARIAYNNGCFDAAYAEGLFEVLENQENKEVGSLYDLVTRRLLFAVLETDFLTALRQHDKEVRAKALEEAAKYFAEIDSGLYAGYDIANELRQRVAKLTEGVTQ